MIPKLLKTCRRQPDTELTRIWDLWEGIVGEMLAENARPAAFKGRLILVHVESPAWVHHLQFLKSGLIKKINDALGEPLVDDIKFKVGPL
jgi:predicted nucleic acid-binding Zn ribbon protein